jgi:hypothetical protein
MRGDGKGKLTIEYTRAERSGDGCLVSGDFDGDGDVDVAWGAGDLQVRLNDGNGTLEEAYSVDTGLIGVSAMAAGDLDGDGRLDLVVGDADGQGIVLVRNRSSSRSSDTRQPGVPDECHAVEFHRGDPNGDSRTDVTDAIFILRFLFFDGETPLCSEAADADNDGSINITDGIVILRFLFLGASSLPSPGEVGLPCGVDPDPPGSVGDLGCSSYAACTDG